LAEFWPLRNILCSHWW